MEIGVDIVRRELPDGRGILVERWDVGAALGGVAWHVTLESDPDDPATGSPLVVVLALMLGHEFLPATWPGWMYSLAEEVEGMFAISG